MKLADVPVCVTATTSLPDHLAPLVVKIFSPEKEHLFIKRIYQHSSRNLVGKSSKEDGVHLPVSASRVFPLD